LRPDCTSRSDCCRRDRNALRSSLLHLPGLGQRGFHLVSEPSAEIFAARTPESPVNTLNQVRATSDLCHNHCGLLGARFPTGLLRLGYAIRNRTIQLSCARCFVFSRQKGARAADRFDECVPKKQLSNKAFFAVQCEQVNPKLLGRTV